MSETKSIFSVENLESLIKASKNDKDLLEFIASCLKSFEDYHRAIYDMETWLKLYDCNALGREEYQDALTSYDKARTTRHDTLLGSVNGLNRAAQKAGIGLIYSGVVSKERPYRREVANAALDFVEMVIKERR